jgi:hypothetical protein
MEHGRLQTMSNANAEPKPSYYELTVEELEKATGGSKATGGASREGLRPQISDITITKLMDSSSPGLF